MLPVLPIRPIRFEKRYPAVPLSKTIKISTRLYITQ
jgi:hypothetical protein